MYSIPPFTTTTEFLIHIARLRGRMRKGGIPDLENAARSILQDWNAGRIPYYTLPPKNQSTDVAASVVERLSDEFEMADVVQVEGKQMETVSKSKSEMSSRMFVMSSSEVLDIEMDGDMPNEYLLMSQKTRKEEEQQGEEEASMYPILFYSTIIFNLTYLLTYLPFNLTY